MTDLPTKSAASSNRERQRTRAATGAALAALVWLECIALGLPQIVFGKPGYAVIPIAAMVGALLGFRRAHRLLLATSVGLAVVLAVVVLSGGITSDGHLAPPVVDRTLTGLSLIRRGLATTLIVSRERLGPPGQGVTSDADQQRLVALLERPVRLLIVDSVFSTRDEAVRMRALARSLDVTSVAVVTSPMHTYRACATFEKAGFTVTCVPSDSRDVALGSLRAPTDRVRAFQLWLYELAGLTKYRLQRWI